MQRYQRLLIVLSAFLLTGCGFNAIVGSGRIITETRPVSGFDAVELNGSGDLIITQGDEEGLAIEAEDNLLPHLRAEVRGGTLMLGPERRGWLDLIRPTQPIRYRLAVRELRALALSGSGTIQAGALSGGNLAIEVNGSGDVVVDQLTATDVTYELSGAGDASLAGEVTTQRVEISGSGSYQAGDLASQTAEVSISGAGDAMLWVQERLDVSISGSGTVNYYGAPAVSSEVSGAGELIRLGEK